MTTYMPPIKRKKRAANIPPAGLNSTRRVFGNYDGDAQANGSHYATNFQGKRHSSQPKPCVGSSTRHNKPHPVGVGFLQQDCATLNQPICDVKTKVDPEDVHWWPSRANQNTNTIPVYTKDTVSRGDFRKHADPPPRQTRHGSNPNKVAAQGPVPITNLPNPTGPRLLVEHISYEHGYDSRKADNQPQRGKLRGSFVWDVLHPMAKADSTASNAQTFAPVAGILLPGRGSENMRSILSHDLIAEPNQAIRNAQFPSRRKPLKAITGKIGGSEAHATRTEARSEGIRHDTLLPLPAIIT
ncbi:ciliary microtubule inner protein 6-like [Diadema antillarum]|uniref:ciliary microtubule inner protein 6-like n=1 Tax=Diadema antillarum TaxID=105358 RepID=UPI003A871517